MTNDYAIKLHVLKADEPPRFSGLRRDVRAMVVGAEALVVVRGSRRQAAFLAALSRTLDLARGVTIERVTSDPKHADLAATLTPPDGDTPSSLFFDTIQRALAAARLGPTHAQVYVGDGRVFVPYADPAAPYGYDARGEPPTTERTLLHPDGLRVLPTAEPTPILDALLDLPLEPAPPAALSTLAVLADRRLAALIAGYALRHGLGYTARFVDWRRGETTTPAALFDIVASEGRAIPGFVGDFLRRLPRTALLSDALEPADLAHEPPRRILVAADHRAPFYLPHVQGLLSDTALLILAAPPWGAALISPPPPRQPMQQLVDVAAPVAAQVTIGTHTPAPMHLELTFWPDAAARGPVHGLLLDATAIARLRRMARRLPGPFFANARIALGDGVAILIADTTCTAVAGVPLGQPLNRTEPASLLVPRGLHLRPALPPALLATALDLRPDTLTVLTPTRRYDAPLAAFQPLSALLKLDAPAQPVAITLRPGPLPPLDLSDLDANTPTPQPNAPPAPTTSPVPPAAPSRRGLLDRVLSSKTAAPERPPFEDELRQRADELRRRGDYGTAAVFYDYLNETQRALECYRKVVEG